MSRQYGTTLSRRRPSFETLEPRLALSGGGLTAQYFHNADFTGLAETRTEGIAHNWGLASPAAGVDADTFSVRWTGQIVPEFTQTYTFQVISDESVRVWIDGRLLIDDSPPHTAQLRLGSIALEADQRYDIRVDYSEGTGNARIELSWSSANQPLQVIPSSRLYESPTGLLGSYSDIEGGNVTRIDSTVDFNWGLAAPHVDIDRDEFTVNWTGQIRADFNEHYTFATFSDERVRLRIGGELVIDHWTDHTATEDQGTKWLEAGKWYEVRLEYFDNTGPAEIELRWSSASQTGSGVFEVIPQENLRAIAASMFENPFGPGADPYVTQWQNSYYMTRSQGNSVWVNRADALQDIHDSSPGSDTTIAWTAPAGTNYSQQIWAPELHRLGNNWYIYVAASDGNNATHRMHVLERVGPDPFGPYNYKGQLAAVTDRWAIDGTVLEWQGALYFVWSGWPEFSDGVQNLYIAEMRNPWTLRGDRALIASPQYSWEMHGLSLNEGPQILIHDGQLHIIYSASGFWTPQYALGRLTYNGTGSLMDADSWTKAPQPVFHATDHVVGVGHASFTKSPDGTEDWIVYHAHANPNVFHDDRVVSIQRFTYAADGTPDFGSPLPTGQRIPVPATGAEPERVFLAGDYNADAVVDAHDHDTWIATFGASVFPGSAADGSGNGVVDAADFVMWRDRRSQPNAAAMLVNDTEAPVRETNYAITAKDESAYNDAATVGEGASLVPAMEAPHRNRLRLTRQLRSDQAAIDAAFQSWPDGAVFTSRTRAEMAAFTKPSAILDYRSLNEPASPQLLAEYQVPLSSALPSLA